MTTRDATLARCCGCRGNGALAVGISIGARNGGKVDDSLTIHAWTGDPHRRGLANQQAVARAANVFFARGRVPDGRGLVAHAAFHDVLMKLPLDIDHSLTHSATDYWSTA